jgi:hypothetical protein
MGGAPVNGIDPAGRWLTPDTILDIGFIAYNIYALATGGRKALGIKLSALGADIGGLLIPGVTALGTASRVAREGKKLLPFVPRLAQGNLKMGLEHIVYRHWHSSGFAHVSKFGADVGVKELRGIIHDAATRGAGWRVEGASRVIESNVGRVIGTDPAGHATSWVSVVTNQAGEVITAYPIPLR